jgi:hypothetical protein
MYYQEALSHKVAAATPPPPPPPRRGTINYLNGSYTGDLDASRPNGNGKLTTTLGKKISGMWRNGKLNLRSVTIEHTSEDYTYKYEGVVNEDFQRQGKGKLTMRKKTTEQPSGAGDLQDVEITGDWYEDNPLGKMKKVDQFGTYIGELDDMLGRNGKNATLKTRDGRKITGRWGGYYDCPKSRW